MGAGIIDFERIPNWYIEQAVNDVFPGTQMLVRDCNLTAEQAAQYEIGRILREPGFTDATHRVMGMATTHRIAIITNHMRDISDAIEDAEKKAWGLCLAQSNSRFKVLDVYGFEGKTQILLLHLPDDERWRLFDGVVMSVEEDMVASCRERFENKCNAEVIPELATDDWLGRCAYPIGLDDDGRPFDREAALEDRLRPLGEEIVEDPTGMAARALAGDADTVDKWRTELSSDPDSFEASMAEMGLVPKHKAAPSIQDFEVEEDLSGSERDPVDFNCPGCGKPIHFEAWTLLNAQEDPEAAQRLIAGTLSEFTCPSCGYTASLTHPCLYLDPEHNVFVYSVLDDRMAAGAEEMFAEQPEGRRCRIVSSRLQLQDKAAIFMAGLDDRPMEILKTGLTGQAKLQGLVAEDEECEAYFTGVGDDGELMFDIQIGDSTFSSSIDKGGYDLFASDLAKSSMADDQPFYADRSWAYKAIDKYDKIEEDVAAADPYDECLTVNQAWAERFLAEAAAREANAALGEGEVRPLTAFASSAKALREAFDSRNLAGKSIVSIDVVGEMEIPTHQSMIDLYNNVLRADDEPFRRGVISEDEIPLDLEETRMVTARGPLILGFDDGSSLEISFDNVSEAFLAWGRSDERAPNPEVNASKIMCQIIGEHVSSVEVMGPREGSWEWEQSRKTGIADPFKYVLIRCDSHMLYISWSGTCALMPNGSELAPLSMTMGELKDSISYYGELFD